RFAIPVACAFLCFSGVAFGQQPDYLPLQVGNQWVYQVAPRGQPVVMEVLKSTVFNDNTYYLTRNFLNGDSWLRITADLALVSYNPQTKLESVLAMFAAAEGFTYKSSLDPCNSSAKIVSRSMKVRLPIGQFDSVLAIEYPPGVCADAGLAT